MLSRRGAAVCILLTLSLAAWSFWGQSEKGEAGESGFKVLGALPIVPYHAPPQEMTLCGLRVPLEDPEVMERFDREFTIVVYSHAQVYLWLKRMERYFPWIEEQLRREGLPDDLKFLAVAESDLLHTAVSPAGAAGPWQFIKSTGTRYGLNQSEGIDERYDFQKSTASAFAYLKGLHAIFNDWALAMAAYNCGENRVREELARQKVGNYYALRLPLETERYIFRILAIKAVLSRPERYGFSLPGGAGYRPLPSTESVFLTLPYDTPLQAVAEVAGVTYRQFKLLNPSFISTVVPRGTHSIQVPQGKAQIFIETMDSIKENFKPQRIEHRVKQGETLNSIAAQYGVAVRDLRSWNELSGDVIRVDQTLVIHRIPQS